MKEGMGPSFQSEKHCAILRFRAIEFLPPEDNHEAGPSQQKHSEDDGALYVVLDDWIYAPPRKGQSAFLIVPPEVALVSFFCFNLFLFDGVFSCQPFEKKYVEK
jgi:hypothetical protein